MFDNSSNDDSKLFSWPSWRKRSAIGRLHLRIFFEKVTAVVAALNITFLVFLFSIDQKDGTVPLMIIIGLFIEFGVLAARPCRRAWMILPYLILTIFQLFAITIILLYVLARIIYIDVLYALYIESELTKVEPTFNKFDWQFLQTANYITNGLIIMLTGAILTIIWNTTFWITRFTWFAFKSIRHDIHRSSTDQNEGQVKIRKFIERLRHIDGNLELVLFNPTSDQNLYRHTYCIV